MRSLILVRIAGTRTRAAISCIPINYTVKFCEYLCSQCKFISNIHFMYNCTYSNQPYVVKKAEWKHFEDDTGSERHGGHLREAQA
jgi:hypothetical protein